MSKKSNLIQFVKDNKDKIIDYLDIYAKECDIEMGSHYENAKGLLEAFEHDIDFIFQIFDSMLDEYGMPLDDDEELFEECYDEIEDILIK